MLLLYYCNCPPPQHQHQQQQEEEYHHYHLRGKKTARAAFVLVFAAVGEAVKYRVHRRGPRTCAG